MTFDIRIVAPTATDLRGQIEALAQSFGIIGGEIKPLAALPAAPAAEAAAEPSKPKGTRRTKEQIAADEAAKAAAAQPERQKTAEELGRTLSAKEAEKLTKVMGADATVVPPKDKPASDPIQEEIAEENAADNAAPEEADPLGEDAAAPQLSYSDVSDKCMEVRKHPKLGVPELIALCKPFGIKKMAELKEEDYGKLYAAAEALLKKAGPAA